MVRLDAADALASCDEESMRKTRFGRRLAHGALAVGLMSRYERDARRSGG